MLQKEGWYYVTELQVLPSFVLHIMHCTGKARM